jgi:hypothetical protein
MQPQWFVSYKIPLVSQDKVHICGPYKYEVEALMDADDLRGYMGVSELRIYKEDIDTQLSKIISAPSDENK